VLYTGYLVEAETSLLKFEFFSEGPKGKIRKQIIFMELEEIPMVFNLGFGDVDENGEINDTVVSNNQDSRRVLATVALAIYKFYERYPNASVFATGNTRSRTRLYRMGISNNLTEIGKDFEIYGLIGEDWEYFIPGREYEGFMINLRKSGKFEYDQK
jgi:hypothetical protein